MSSALYNRVATVLILSQIAMSLGYRGAKLATPELASFTTSSASSVVPFPPSSTINLSVSTKYSDNSAFLLNRILVSHELSESFELAYNLGYSKYFEQDNIFSFFFINENIIK